MTRNGYTVVFPTYDSGLQPPQFTSSIVSSWQAALSLLETNHIAGLVPPASDAAGLQTLFTGHSLGAVESFAVAQQLTANPIPGVPVPRAIAAFQPGLGKSGELPMNFGQIDPGIRVVLVDGDQDSSDLGAAQTIWNSIVETIPSSNRDFLEVISDSHGSPAQIGNHWYPNTNGYLDDVTGGVDDRDYNITWKLSVGLFQCVLSAANCSFGLGHGSVNQTNMGAWSDGTPVTPLSLLGGGSPSITAVSSGTNPSTYGAPVVLTSTVAASGSPVPTGVVTFTDGSNSLGSATLTAGSASITLGALSLGNHSISARYSGDLNFQQSSGVLLQAVSAAASATALLSGLNPAAFGSSVTFSAQVSPAAATGVVTFSDGATLLGTVPLAGGAASFTTSAMASGTHLISAVYSGDSIFPASSATLSQAINQLPTSLALVSSLNPAGLGQQTSFFATLSGSGAAGLTGSVTFSQNGTPLAAPVPVTSGQASVSLAFGSVGTYTIGAVYSGDLNDQASNASLLQTVGQPVQLPLTTIHSFAGSDGSAPSAGLVLGVDGSYYGTTSSAQSSAGTVFKVSSTGTLTPIYAFSGADGAEPSSSLVSGGDGNFYGATFSGGTNDLGTVFQITPAGLLTTLYDFSGPDGSGPMAALVLGSNGSLYGSTSGGGANGNGTLFTITTSGSLQTLYSFQGADGSSPNAALVLGNDANYYGSTSSGGTNNNGTLFRITPAGVLTTLHLFSGSDGSSPVGPLALSTDGYFYGTTASGGANANAAYGTVFKLSTNGALTTVYNFSGPDGSGPRAALFPGSDGNFYSTTSSGGPNGQFGTVFSITPGGALTTLYSFAGPDGTNPSALAFGPDGNFYGTTSSGGANGYGSVFCLNVTPAFTTTAVFSNATPSAYGAPLTFTSTIQSASVGTPTGFVVFSDSGAQLATVPVVAGSAAFTTSNLSPGQHSVTAAYGGDAGFKPSTGSLLQSISTSAVATAVVSSLNPSAYGQAVTLTVTVSAPQGSVTPTGSITFMDGPTNLGVVTLTGGGASTTLPGLSGGTHSISASYSGDANYSSGIATVPQTVNPVASATRVVSNVNPSAYGQLVSITASAASVLSAGTPTGTFTFTDGATMLGSVSLVGGSGSITTSSLLPGSHSIVVMYNGDTDFQPSNATLSQLVSAAATTTTITSSQNPSSYNQAVTLVATVTPAPGAGTPTGTVTFTKGTVPLATVALTNGIASFSIANLPVGTQTLSAAYGGSPSFQLSSGSISQITGLEPVTASVASNLNPASAGSQVTLSAVIAPQFGGTPTGTITFLENGAAIGSAAKLSGNKAVLTTSFATAGSFVITAVYSGDSHFAGVSSPGTTEQINPLSTKTSIKSSISPSLAGTPVTFTATVTVTAASTLVPDGEQVTFYNGTTPIGAATTLAGTAALTTVALPSGTFSIAATYAGDARLQPSSSSAIRQVVNHNATATVLSTSINPSAYGQLVTLSAKITSAGPTATGSVTFKNGTTAIGSGILSSGVASFSAANLPSGPDSLTATYGGDLFSAASSSAPLVQTVNPAATTTSIASSNNPGSAGTSITFTAAVTSALIPSGSVTFSCGSTVLGTAVLVSGKASVATSTLPSGTDTVTASFGATANFLASSASMQQTIQ